MKKICFFVNLLLIVHLGVKAQLTVYPLQHSEKNISDNIKNSPIYALPENYYSSNLGFFCKKELQFQKAVKLSVKFRLGTVEYCNAIEGKNNQDYRGVKNKTVLKPK